MGFGRKQRRQIKRKLAGTMSNEQADRMIEAGNAMMRANACTAQNLLAEAKPAMEKDIRAHYEREVVRLKGVYEELAQKEARAYEDECRRVYDERTKIPKSQLRLEVIGDIMIMSIWTLMDKLNFTREQLHDYLLNFFTLQADMLEPRIGITINDLVEQLKIEGYDMHEDIDLISEMVDADMERYDDLFDKPAAAQGSVFNKWRPKEDTRLLKLIGQGRDYMIIGKILKRTEGACKSRARKLWGTSDAESICERVASQ